MFPDSHYGAFAGAVYSGLLVCAAVGDVLWRRIPNTLVLWMMVSGLGYSVIAKPGFDGLYHSAGGLAVGLACWLPFYALAWVGAGDVKLFGAAGVWLGPLRTIEGAGMAAVVGGILGLLWMVWHYGVRNALGSLWIASVIPSALASAGAEAAQSRRTLPYGVALAAGALAAGWMPWLLVLG